MIYAADKALRDFLGISSIRNPAIFNNRNYEDPTYPIFHIKFAFNPPEAKHPDYVTNRLLSKLEDESSAINDESAIKYLYNIGEPERAVMLKKFNIALRSISEKTPWYFQKIDRLSELYSHGYETERGERELSPVILTINTLESIDYKILSLKDLYRKVAYDRKFRRWILPVNMRRFRMSIMIGDYRQMAKTEDNFSITGSSALSTLRDIDIFNSSNVGGQLVDRAADGQIDFIKRLQWWDNHFSCMVFDCQDCEFDMNSFEPSSIDHNEAKKPQTNSFKIKVGRVLETNTYSLLEYILSDNLFENFLKSSDREKVITQSKKLREIVKPVVSSWKSFPNLEREKGNNRRIILDDNGVGQAVRGAINEVLDFVGLDSLFEGTNLGESGGFLGSVGDFVGDTLAGVAQELVGQATEQLVTNIFTDDFLRTTAGIGLGILGGDIRNGNRTGNQNQPNLRDNIPTKLNLEAPAVQRSLTDVQANLSGEGADPRFRSIGRPGRNLFITPETDLSLGGNQRVFVQESLYLEPPRVETEMPDNIEFDQTRKETTLSPNQADLTGAGKKTDLIPDNANLNGAQPLKDLIPNNANLTGAQPLKDLIPDNADLNGAQPLDDLIPDNADLNGAQPLKDLIPNNADLNGAQPSDNLTPNQIELNGASPQTQLTPAFISLLGADPIKSFDTPQVQLEGSQPNSELVPTNVTLEGANKIETLIPKQVILEGTNPVDAFNKSNVDLSGSPVSSTFETKTVNLLGAESLTKFNEINTNLEGSQPIEKINQQNIDFQNNVVNTSFNSETIELVEPKILRNLTETRTELTSPSVLKSISETNAELSSPSVQTRISETSVDLEGSKKVEITSKNINLSGNSPIKEFNNDSIELIGSRPKIEQDVINEPLEGSDPLRSITQRNVGDMVVKDSIPITSLGTEELNGKKPLNSILEPNANLTGAKPLEKIIDDNVEFEITNKTTEIDKNFKLKGAPAMKSLNEDNLGYKGITSVNGIPNSYRSKGIYSDSLSNSQTSTNNDIKPIINEDFTLEGAEPMTELNPTNVNLHGKSVEQDINNLGNIQFEVRKLNNTLSADKNLGLQASLIQTQQTITNLELKGNEPYTINPNYENQGFIGDPKKQNMPTENIQLDEQKTPTPIKTLNVGVQIK